MNEIKLSEDVIELSDLLYKMKQEIKNLNTNLLKGLVEEKEQQRKERAIA